MDFSLGESERDLVGLCRDFAQREIVPRAPLAWEEARCPTDLLREMGAPCLIHQPRYSMLDRWIEDGLTTVEREELSRLQRENRQLKLERDILSKAAAWFARETDVIPPKGSNS